MDSLRCCYGTLGRLLVVRVHMPTEASRRRRDTGTIVPTWVRPPGDLKQRNGNHERDRSDVHYRVWNVRRRVSGPLLTYKPDDRAIRAASYSRAMIFWAPSEGPYLSCQANTEFAETPEWPRIYTTTFIRTFPQLPEERSDCTAALWRLCSLFKPKKYAYALSVSQMRMRRQPWYRTNIFWRSRPE